MYIIYTRERTNKTFSIVLHMLVCTGWGGGRNYLPSIAYRKCGGRQSAAAGMEFTIRFDQYDGAGTDRRSIFFVVGVWNSKGTKITRRRTSKCTREPVKCCPGYDVAEKRWWELYGVADPLRGCHRVSDARRCRLARQRCLRPWIL